MLIRSFRPIHMNHTLMSLRRTQTVFYSLTDLMWYNLVETYWWWEKHTASIIRVEEKLVIYKEFYLLELQNCITCWTIVMSLIQHRLLHNIKLQVSAFNSHDESFLSVYKHAEVWLWKELTCILSHLVPPPPPHTHTHFYSSFHCVLRLPLSLCSWFVADVQYSTSCVHSFLDPNVVRGIYLGFRDS
jgi:hypothetical protein